MVLFVAIWAFTANWLAYNKGIYHLPKIAKKSIPRVTFLHILASFGLYLAFSFLLAPIIVKGVKWLVLQNNPSLTSLPIPYLIGLQAIFMTIVFLLAALCLYEIDGKVFRKIWKDKTHPHAYPIGFDFGLGVLLWFLSFPLVTILSEVSDFIIEAFFGVHSYEQAAVRFFKAAVSAPSSLIFAFLSLLILAPLTEELLFRGVLQTFLKRHLGVKAAIALSALSFALFHYSPSQGLGNITLITSFILLGGFLGFVYERQGSLWASIGLHMTFNGVSAIRILVSPELQ
ncbi:MAG: hypothetical protein KR126chlam1_01402 [Chlamydiae bacterium]|nr:hypothetical protein [Chlamydiota bacterium]